MDRELLNRIIVDPKITVGKPVIRGTRISVELIVRMVSQGIPDAESLREYPRLERQDLRAAGSYAAQAAVGDDVLPTSITS